MLAAEVVEPVRHYTAAEFAAEFERGRREGARQADTGVDRRFVEFRSEVSAVQNGFFSRLGEAEKMIADQIRLVLPDLAVEVARRVLAGFTPPPEVVAQLCQQALVALFPETDSLPSTPPASASCANDAFLAPPFEVRVAEPGFAQPLAGVLAQCRRRALL